MLFAIRVIAFSITTLPPTIEECVGKYGNSIQWFVFPFDQCCSDYIFSGHAVHFTLIFLYTQVYSKVWLEKKIIEHLFIPYLLMIVASRLHYSVDVFLGTVMSMGMFCLIECQKYFILYI